MLGRINYLRLALIALGIGLLLNGSYMQIKAQVAQWLISASWHVRAKDQAPRKPWWWSDTGAIAKLEVAALKQSRYVMDSSSGQALAFGPGHLPQSASPGGSGHVVIAGHRDSHFGFLEEVKMGDIINTEHHSGSRARYRVVGLEIIDVNQQGIRVVDEDRLTLVTCYPFDGWLPGGPLRYLVQAQRIPEIEASSATMNRALPQAEKRGQNAVSKPNQTKPPSQPLLRKA